MRDLMRAVAYQHSLPITDSNALLDIEIPKPLALGRDLLVKIEAISVNPVDTKIRQRVDPQGENKILGWDAAGVIESIGDEASLFSVGDKVWYAGALDRQGTNAEYHLVDERLVAKMPKSLNFVEAAALPLTTITAWETLFDRLSLTKKQKGHLLIIGAAGGVGSIMIQLAKQLTSLKVIASASRPETTAWVKELGADKVINHRHLLSDELKEVGLDNVEYVAALTHTVDYLQDIAEFIAPQGHIGVIDDLDVFDIMPFKRKSVAVHWEFMFTRSLFKTEDMIKQHELLGKVAKMVDKEIIRTTSAENYGTINAANLIKAHALLELGKAKGKIVLAGFD